MATSTYNLIASQVVGSGGASSVDFSSIPQTYTDLKLVMSVRCNNAAFYSKSEISFNGSTSNQVFRDLTGDGSSPSSSNASNFQFIGVGNNNTANIFSNTELYIPNYTSSNYKCASLETNDENNSTAAGAAYVEMQALLWSSTAAINEITITGITGNFVQYSTFYLYGIINH